MSGKKGTETAACAIITTRLGHLGIAWTEQGINCVQLPEKNKIATLQRLRARFPHKHIPQSDPPAHIRQSITKLARFADEGKGDLSGINLDWRSVPPFHRQVYEVARLIPAGKMMTYRQLAEAAGSPAASRAVGQAMARNPFPLIVPCHRVVASNGKPGGFSAYGGLDTKQRLLSQEGASLSGSKRVARAPRAAVAVAVSRRERKYAATAGGATVKSSFAPSKRALGELPFDRTEAQEHLLKVDRRLGRVIEKVGPLRLELDHMLTPFEALAESIVYQQLTGKAAATIFARFKALYGGNRLPHPRYIVETPDSVLRSAGLSGAKSAALKDLAAKHADGLIPTLDQLHRMDNEEIVEKLTAVRGIGRWTVEMLLIFRLGRPDVLPCSDYGVRKGFARTYKRGDKLPTPKELEAAGEKWRPFRSVAAWYLWRATEL